MKVFIETYGRFIISFICVFAGLFLFRYILNNSSSTFRTYNDDFNVSVSANQVEISSVDVPYFQFDEDKKYLYSISDSIPFITRADFLEGVTAYKKEGSPFLNEEINILVYKYELAYNESGSLIYEEIEARDAFGNILRDSEGNIIKKTQPKYEMKYLGFVPSGTESLEELDSLSQNGIGSINGISLQSPGKYVVTYRIENNKLKAEKDTIFMVEYPLP